jgi:tetratricopeptide (TPR) repeat protein/TolB-like protein
MAYRCRLSALGVTLLIGAAELRAQCPDGSPPPCAQRVASATRVANPPLDERTWIVMPFDNVSNSTDIEWLRTASANLLYLDMSRWQDIRVVDDERVADLLRESTTSTAQTLSLSSALAIAKKAGAGKLVMGDLIKSGNRTMMTAKIFDVRNGQRTNTVRDETSVQDSVIPLFGRLARKILKVDPPPGSSVGMVGTTSVRAYQAYSQGVQALNRLDLDAAKGHLRRALELDSTFALAHFKLTTALGWFEGGDPRRLAHAEASWRFGNSLPERERRLIEAQLWHIRGDLAKATELYAAGVKADSFDVEAWHGLGEATYHDNTVLRDPADTTRVRFRTDWTLAMRAFERVLALDPSYHVAYPHLVDMPRLAFRGGCLFDAERRCTVNYAALVRFIGDSIATTPLAFRDSTLFRAQVDEFVRQGGLRRQLARADTMSLRWLSVASGETYALIDRGRVLSMLGRVREASDVLSRAGGIGGPVERAMAIQARIEVALKALNIREARRLYDSVRAVPTASQTLLSYNDGVLTTISLGDWLGRQLGWTFGQFAASEPFLRGFGNMPSPITMRYRRAFARLMAGLPDSIGAAQQANFDDNTQRLGAASATRSGATVLAWGLNAPREKWPALDTTVQDQRAQIAVAAMRKDVAALRASAQMFDSTSRAITAAFLPDTALSLIAVEAYLAAGDSLAALRTLRFALDTALATRDLLAPISASQTVFYAAVLPRLMLQRADLAAALGHKDEARLWYGRLLELWSNADAELQPTIARVRRAVAALGAA